MAPKILRIDNVIAVSKSGPPTPSDGSGMGMY